MMVKRFIPVKIAQWSGFCLEGFDLKNYWGEIKAQVAVNDPFYTKNEWQQVFKIRLNPQITLYLKIVDETHRRKNAFLNILTSSEAKRYYLNYKILKSNEIMSPDVLFFLEQRRNVFIIKSIIATLELKGYESWPSFFGLRCHNKEFQSLKNSVLQELSKLTAKLHRLGLYFSMDGRNIFVRETLVEGNDNLALIDLDHIKRGCFKKIPQRRQLRNLLRFKKTLKKTKGMSDSDYRFFMQNYEKHYFSFFSQKMG